MSDIFIMSHQPVYYIPQKRKEHSVTQTDIVIYGGNSGAISTAVQARRMGYQVVVLAFNDHIGGLSSGGLGATDIGNKDAIGGVGREFYQRIGAYYGNEINWTFEPKIARKVFQDLIEEHDIPVILHQHLDEVVMDDNRIVAIRMESGEEYRGKIFVDASYEGDLMAKAGVSYTVGRESNDTYDEVFNGIQVGGPHHNFRRFVDPYKIPGKPSSGLLPCISDAPAGINGQGDKSVQAYNFRMCLSTDDNNRKPFPQPKNYNPERYELLRRYIAAGIWDGLQLSVAMPNGKTDTNNFGGFSSDHIGANHEWPEASFARRQEIFQDHLDYHQGFLWFVSYDKSCPEWVHEQMKRYSLTTDEFLATGGWSPELYIREARRMVTDHVMTEHHCVGRIVAEEPIALAAYTMDSHHCRRIVMGGRAINEGDVQIGGFTPYPISFRSIVPREKECANLIVPWCLAASHIAFGSIRMEPVFMVLGQASATIAHFAMRGDCPVQRVSYPELRAQLLKDGQVLEWKS
jgi:hypothetical protein